MRVVIRKKILQERRNLPFKKKDVKKLNESLILGMALGAAILGILSRMFPKLGSFIAGITKKIDEADKKMQENLGAKKEQPKVPNAGTAAAIDPSAENPTDQTDDKIVGDTTVALDNTQDVFDGSTGDNELGIPEEDYKAYFDKIAAARKDYFETMQELSEKVEDAKSAAEIKPRPSVTIAQKLTEVIDAYISIFQTHPEQVKSNQEFKNQVESTIKDLRSLATNIKNIDMMSILASKESGSLYAELPELKELFDQKEENWFKFVTLIADATTYEGTDVASHQFKSVTGISESKKGGKKNVK